MNLFISLITLFFLWALPAHADSVKDVIHKTTADPMPKWQMPLIKKSAIKPGLSFWAMENHDFPTVELFVLLPQGSLSDSDDIFGRSALMARAWRSGGTQLHSPDEFSRALERRSISLAVEVKPEYTLIVLSCLKNDLDYALGWFKEWLLTPGFDAGRFALSKRQMEKELLDVKDYPEHLAAYVYPQTVYGPHNKWGRAPRLSTLQPLTRDKIVGAYRDLMHTGPILTGAAGDISPPSLERAIADIWADRSVSTSHLPTFTPMTRKVWPEGLTLVTKEGDQSTIVAGHLGDRRFNPDKYAIMVANYMLGGDPFSSLLGTDLRVNRGLVYGVFSSFGFESDYGVFKIYAKTKAKQTAQVLHLIREKMAALVSGKTLTDASLALAKRALASDLLFSNARQGELLKTLLLFEFYGYPADYLEHFTKNIEAVRLHDVQTVASRYFFPDHLAILVVGPASITPELSAYKTKATLNPEKITR